MSPTAIAETSAAENVAVFRRQTRIGFVRPRSSGQYEAVSLYSGSLGLYTTLLSAANALAERGR